MIDVTNISIPLASFGATIDEQSSALRRAVAHKLEIADTEVESCKLLRRSIDARKKSSIKIVCSARASLAGSAASEMALVDRFSFVRLVKETDPPTRTRISQPLEARPIVVGAGCAGLFCALELAEAGLEPLLIERGDNATRRTAAVKTFNQTGTLDPESNIQFGLGGAGTFSDGKLYTGTKSPAHRRILETFVAAGASPDILIDSHPHIGSDVLPAVVEQIRSRIEELGGEVRLRCRLMGIEMSLTQQAGGRHVQAIRVEQSSEDGISREERLATSHLILACGHSARDIFELLHELDITLERKTFAMGVRIEHLQADIDRALWGKHAGNPVLGAAPYKLVAHPKTPSARSVFTFCMCPGGYVVAASSEPGGVVTNGMSLSARDGTNANAGLLANVEPNDLPGSSPLAGIELARSCEQRAFELGGGNFLAPAQLVGDFLQNVASTSFDRVSPTYPRGVHMTSLKAVLPTYITDSLQSALPALGRKLQGFDAPDALLTGVETRSSSPVRITRGDDLQSISCCGLYPCGEGAGYAGGIMSAATDGIRCAHAILKV